MNDYKAVPSGLELSRRVIERLEDAAPNGYQAGERVRAIRAVNDILQGRSTRTAEELLAELEQYGDGPLLDVCGDREAVDLFCLDLSALRPAHDVPPGGRTDVDGKIELVHFIPPFFATFNEAHSKGEFIVKSKPARNFRSPAGLAIRFTVSSLSLQYNCSNRDEVRTKSIRFPLRLTAYGCAANRYPFTAPPVSPSTI